MSLFPSGVIKHIEHGLRERLPATVISMTFPIKSRIFQQPWTDIDSIEDYPTIVTSHIITHHHTIQYRFPTMNYMEEPIKSGLVPLREVALRASRSYSLRVIFEGWVTWVAWVACHSLLRWQACNYSYTKLYHAIPT